jgi:hypothetical protein
VNFSVGNYIFVLSPRDFTQDELALIALANMYTPSPAQSSPPLFAAPLVFMFAPQFMPPPMMFMHTEVQVGLLLCVLPVF